MGVADGETKVVCVEAVGVTTGNVTATTVKETVVTIQSPPKSGLVSQVSFKTMTLADVRDKTHFGANELSSILNHFLEQSAEDHTIDLATFRKYLGHAFGMDVDDGLLSSIFEACDAGGNGRMAFSQFAIALSTIFRGEQDEVWNFWFDMYDKKREDMLSRAQMDALLHDVDPKTREALQTSLRRAFLRCSRQNLAAMVAQTDDDGPADGANGTDSPRQMPELITREAFLKIMRDHHVLPSFFTPHRQQGQHQQSALRDLTPGEREVLALLGAELQLGRGTEVIGEEKTHPRFYFIMEGRVGLSRHGTRIAIQGPGTFLGEAALFDDIKQVKDGTIEFTTSAHVVSKTARILRMSIADFIPLVFHEHPGATAIVQRLGRVMMERFEQTEERLQAILADSGKQADAGMRLSSRDWAAWRAKLTRLWALRYHRIGRAGKLEIVATKQMGSAADLSVAYSPGVAEPCLSIQADPSFAFEYTGKGHLVGVVTNGTAVLGLGNIGPLAAKPVMEGKAVLFKKFADLDAFDIELNMPDPEKLVDIVCALEPTFGGINLEDIKSPECFYVERECQRRLDIPVFHDDQHGTAIIAGAGLLNALQLVKKEISEIKVVVCGVGAAGFTCAKYFVSLGVRQANLLAVDVKGVVYAGRSDLTPDNYLTEVAVETELRTLKEAIAGADVFLGLSAGNLLSPEMLMSMGRDPVVFACANPIPEIDYDLAKETRPDVIMATGRSDFPNQINNVCAFPYIFRGALDCRAKGVNEAMKRAATQAIAELARTPMVARRRRPSALDEVIAHGSSSQLARDLDGEGGAWLEGDSGDERELEAEEAADNILLTPEFGREYIIPKPFDERLLPEVAAAVVGAAIETGMARVTDMDLEKYRSRLTELSERMRDQW